MSAHGPDDDRGRGVPSMAELDAMDMAEIAAKRTSADKDLREAEVGDPPRALHHAVLFWIPAAACGVFSAGYGFVNLSAVTDALRDRLTAGLASDPNNAAPAGQIHSLSSTVPPVLLVCTVIALAIQYPLLAGIARHHSRGCRNFYVTAVVCTLVAIPIGVDLLFDYPSLSGIAVVVGWIQFALLLISMVLTLRRSVNLWLPSPMRLRPGQSGPRTGLRR